jgi:hypothetical protein
LGNSPDVDQGKLEKFDQLLEKFQGLHELLENGNLTNDDKTRIASNLHTTGITTDAMTTEVRAVFEQALPVYQEINHLILDLGTKKEIPGGEVAHAVAENFRNSYGEGRKAASGKDSHFNIDWETAITSDIFNQANPEFPATCKVEIDMMSRSNFELHIGDESITKDELIQRTSTEAERKTATRRWILDAIQGLTNDKDQQVAILRNFLSTCVGQAVNADVRTTLVENANNEHESFDVAQPNDIFYGVTISADGACHIENTTNYHRCASSPPDDPMSAIFVPCDIQVTITYTSSVEDFTHNRPPHVVEEQCTCSGHYLDLSAMV